MTEIQRKVLNNSFIYLICDRQLWWGKLRGLTGNKVSRIKRSIPLQILNSSLPPVHNGVTLFLKRYILSCTYFSITNSSNFHTIYHSSIQQIYRVKGLELESKGPSKYLQNNFSHQIYRRDLLVLYMVTNLPVGFMLIVHSNIEIKWLQADSAYEKYW